MTTFAAKFDISEPELRAGSALHVRALRRSLIFAAAMFILLAGIHVGMHYARCCSTLDLGRQILSRLGVAVAFGIGFYLLQRFVLIPKLCRKTFRQNPFFYNGIAIEIDERGFRLRGPKTQSDWLWSDLIGYRENPEIFLIYASQSLGHVIPKRVFSAEDLAALTLFLEGRLKRLPSF